MELLTHAGGSMNGKTLDGVILAMCTVDHTAHQMTRVSLGERTALSPRTCKQCKDCPLDGIYTVETISGTHYEPLCDRCAFLIAPHRLLFGVRFVKLVTLYLRVTREGSDWQINGGIS